MIRTGLIGRGIGASRSPWLHESAARAQGIDLAYALLDFDRLGLDDTALGPFVRRLAGDDFAGVNVTHPFKQAVIAALDEVAESARLVGAVNTIAIRDGRLTGHNTDMAGFKDCLARDLAGTARDRVLQMGAGGAGAAVAMALLAAGADRLFVADTDRGRAAALCARLDDRFGGGRVVAVDGGLPVTEVDGIVNATPIGMAAHPGTPFDPALLDPRQWVADIIYFPIETALLAAARARGCRVVNGGSMVVAQAAAAFKIMTGHATDIGAMRANFLAAAG